MFDIEPYFNWRDEYIAEEDEYSPFYGRKYSEFEFGNAIYNYYIHPQWDDFGSPTLYLKQLYADYETGYTIIELIGEWNDCISNDIMLLKRDVIDHLIDFGINKFILIGENVLNFHFDSDDYYQEWSEDIENGWIAGINFMAHVKEEFDNHHLDSYLAFGGFLDEMDWRTYRPRVLFNEVENAITKKLKMPENTIDNF